MLLVQSVTAMAVMTLVPASFELHRQINIAYVQQALINIAIDGWCAGTREAWHSPFEFTNELIDAGGIKFSFKASREHSQKDSIMLQWIALIAVLATLQYQRNSAHTINSCCLFAGRFRV